MKSTSWSAGESQHLVLRQSNTSNPPSLAEEAVWLANESWTVKPTRQDESKDPFNTGATPIFSNPPESSNRSRFAGVLDGTALAGLSVAIALHNPLPGIAATPTSTWTAESNATASKLVYSTIAAIESLPTGTSETHKAVVPASIIRALRQAVGRELENANDDSDLSKMLEHFVKSFGAEGVTELGHSIQMAEQQEYERSAVLLVGLISAAEQSYREESIGLLITLLSSASPALRYEATATLRELGAMRSISHLEEAASRERSNQLREYMLEACRTLRE